MMLTRRMKKHNPNLQKKKKTPVKAVDAAAVESDDDDDDDDEREDDRPVKDALFIGDDSDSDEDEDEKSCCGICKQELSSGTGRESGKPFLMCQNGCEFGWVEFSKIPKLHVQIENKVLPKFRAPNPRDRCNGHKKTSRLIWVQKSANNSLVDKMFFVCAAKKEDGGKCDYLRSADHAGDAAKKLELRYRKAIVKERKDRKNAKKAVFFNFNEARLDYENKHAAKCLKKGGKKNTKKGK